MKLNRNKFYLLFGFYFTILMALPGMAKELSTAETLALIHPLEPLAIQYGSGETKAYVFLDPKCPHSRDFLSMVHDNEKMQERYHYYIFLYELKRFHSHNLIGTIYGSASPLQTTLDVMTEGKEIKEQKKASLKTTARINAIEDVAEKIGVNKRPYLIIKKEVD